MSEHMMPIPSRLYNSAVGGHVAGADQIIDDETGLTLDKVTGGALEEKEYTSGSNNGMGRVVLRKNLVNGVNTLTQNMINKSNTIYVIQYDFTLGEDITILANCILEFEGGSISGNGTGKDIITGNNTQIVANKVIIFKDITIEGSWNVITIYDNWFSNNIGEQAIINCIALTSESINNIVYIDNDYDVTVKEIRTERYDPDFPGIPDTFIILKSNTVLNINGVWRETDTKVAASNIIEIINVSNVTVKGNGQIIGDLDTHTNSGHPTDEWNHGIKFHNAKNCSVDGLTISKLVGDSININGGNSEDEISSNVTVKNCIINDSKRQGISVEAGELIKIDNCFIYNIINGAPSAAIDCEPSYGRICRDILISDVIVKNCVTAIQSVGATNVVVENIHVELTDNSKPIGSPFILLSSTNINLKNIHIKGTRTEYVTPGDVTIGYIIYTANTNMLNINSLNIDVLSYDNGPRKISISNCKNVNIGNSNIKFYDKQYFDITNSDINIYSSTITSNDTLEQQLEAPLFYVHGKNILNVNNCLLSPDKRCGLVYISDGKAIFSDNVIQVGNTGYGFAYIGESHVVLINNLMNLSYDTLKAYISFTSKPNATISNNTFTSDVVDGARKKTDNILYNWGSGTVTVYTTGNNYNDAISKYGIIGGTINIEKKTGF